MSLSEPKSLNALSHLYGIGYNLIPCNVKKPCESWKTYQAERVPTIKYKRWAQGQFVRDDGTQWQLQFGPINWALLTGSKPYSDAPALVCIDADDAEAIDLATSICAPTPAMQTTPGGGRHFLYRRPAVDYIGQYLGVTLGNKKYRLDIKADGNYIMAPGSVKNNREYEWDCPWSLGMLNSLPVYDLTWFPPQLRTKGKKSENPTLASLDDHADVIKRSNLPIELRMNYAQDWIANCPGSTAGRGAHSYCFALAMSLVWGFLLPASDAYDVLYEWAQTESNVDCFGRYYPWSVAEITHKISNALATEYHCEVGDRLTADAYLSTLVEEVYNGREKEEQTKCC